jgi:3-hydroxyisobutyrate dehydrogenase-like beta-hydroxyacid dehydrogenase
MHIAFIGAGGMSRPMIENLLADGHQVSVWNRTPDKAKVLEAQGAEIAPTPAEGCREGGIVMSCLADDAALSAIFEDEDLLRALGKSAVHLSMSTISAETARRLADQHAKAGVTYLAAPILGRPDAVQARRQSYLLSGSPAAKERILPLLQKLGRAVFDCGEDAGAASIAKINFNFLIAAALEAMAEAFAVVEKSGLDARAFLNMATSTLFGCPLYQNYGRIMLDREYNTPAFSLRLGLKDVELARSTAADCGARMRLAELLRERFSEAVAAGRGELDWSGIAVDARLDAGLDA